MGVVIHRQNSFRFNSIVRQEPVVQTVLSSSYYLQLQQHEKLPLSATYYLITSRKFLNICTGCL